MTEEEVIELKREVEEKANRYAKNLRNVIEYERGIEFSSKEEFQNYLDGPYDFLDSDKDPKPEEVKKMTLLTREKEKIIQEQIAAAKAFDVNNP